MLDYKKRNTLKVIGASGVLAATGSAGAAALLSQSDVVNTQGQHDALEILVIDSGSLADDTVIIGNKTASPVIVSGFLPGTIFYNDKHVNINALIKPLLIEGEFTLQGGQSVSVSGVSSKLNHGDNGEYLWAQEATTILGADTTLVTLGATMHQSQAIVYPVVEALQIA